MKLAIPLLLPLILLAPGLVLAEETPTPAPAEPSESTEEETPEMKLSISEIMIQAHKEGLMKRVAAGATDEEKAQLLAFYEALATKKPPRGSSLDWKERTEILVKAATAVVDGEPNAERSLTRKVNCRDCHRYHKPEA